MSSVAAGNAFPYAGWPTVAQAAAELQVNPKTVRRAIARGDLEAVRIGPKIIRINPLSLRARDLGGAA